MPKISRVSARNITIPLASATSLSSREVRDRHYGLVEIEATDGIKGIGFCYVGSAGGSIFSEIVSALLAPVLLSEDPFRVEGLWSEMYQEALLQGRAGTVLRAISALDIALWDRNSRASRLSLHRFMGAFAGGSVPAYASGGYYLAGKSPEQLGDELRNYVDQGFQAVKMKVGRYDLAHEEARIAAVRERIGSQVILMLDANNAWHDLPTALRFMRMYERYDPYFIEEPFSPDDVQNHARLASLTPVPVATGEIEGGRWRFKELLDARAAAILQTDAAVCGGITEFRRIAATAASYGVTLCPHWFHDLHAQLVAATPNATYVEYFPDDRVLNFRRLLSKQVTVQEGRIILPDAPGLGFDFDEAAVEQFATAPWRG